MAEIEISDEMVEAFQGAFDACPQYDDNGYCCTRSGLAAALAGFEVREEWGVRGVWPDGVAVDDWRGDRGSAEECLKARREIRTEVRSSLIRRCVLKAPIEPVPDPPRSPVSDNATDQ